jgi:hypothetical protein
MRFVRMMMLGVLVLGLTSLVAGEPQIKVGTVKKVDVAAKQIVVQVARELTFTLTDSTKIMEGGAPKKISDIKVDGKVNVVYVKDDDTRIASQATILGGK